MPGPRSGEELRDRRVGTRRLEQLDPALAAPGSSPPAPPPPAPLRCARRRARAPRRSGAPPRSTDGDARRGRSARSSRLLPAPVVTVEAPSTASTPRNSRSATVYGSRRSREAARRPRRRARRGRGGGEDAVLEHRLDPQPELRAAALGEPARALHPVRDGARRRRAPPRPPRHAAPRCARSAAASSPRRGPRARAASARSLKVALGALAVGLVEHEDVGDLHDAGLDRLDVVAQARAPRPRAPCPRSRTTSTSSWPTPTVSTSTQSKPAASSRSTASRVARARPPIAPRVAIERMKTPRIGREPLHPDPVAEHRAAGERRGRVDAEDADGLAVRAQHAARAGRRGSTCRRPAAR